MPKVPLRTRTRAPRATSASASTTVGPTRGGRRLESGTVPTSSSVRPAWSNSCTWVSPVLGAREKACTTPARPSSCAARIERGRVVLGHRLERAADHGRHHPRFVLGGALREDGGAGLHAIDDDGGERGRERERGGGERDEICSRTE